MEKLFPEMRRALREAQVYGYLVAGMEGSTPPAAAARFVSYTLPGRWSDPGG